MYKGSGELFKTDYINMPLQAIQFYDIEKVS